MANWHALNSRKGVTISLSKSGFRLSPLLVEEYHIEKFQYVDVVHYPRTSRLRFRFTDIATKKNRWVFAFGKGRYILDTTKIFSEQTKGLYEVGDWSNPRGAKPDFWIRLPE